MREFRLGRTEYGFDPTATEAIARADRYSRSLEQQQRSNRVLSTGGSNSSIPKEVFMRYGMPICIPVRWLSPTHPISSYRKPSLRLIDSTLSNEGIKFLEENPIHAVLLPYDKSSVIAIDDGHHRTRLSPKHGIHSIPSLVLDIPTLSGVLGVSEQSENLKFRNVVTAAVDSMAGLYGHGRPISPELLPTYVRRTADFVAWLQEMQRSPRIPQYTYNLSLASA